MTSAGCFALSSECDVLILNTDATEVEITRPAICCSLLRPNFNIVSFQIPRLSKPAHTAHHISEDELGCTPRQSQDTFEESDIDPAGYTRAASNIMAANASLFHGSNHKWPDIRPTTILITGPVAIHPSREVFQHYIAAANDEAQKPGTAHETMIPGCISIDSMRVCHSPCPQHPRS